MLILIILAIISFFFPPMWFVFAIYLLWFFLTAKKRRDNLLDYEIQKMLASGRGEVVLKHIYWEAAASYAVAHGAKMDMYTKHPSDETSYTINFPYKGQLYSIMLSREMDGSTYIMDFSENMRQVNDHVANLFNNIHDQN
nr:hypothetical protein [Moraxella sp. CTOTU47579]